MFYKLVRHIILFAVVSYRILTVCGRRMINGLMPSSTKVSSTSLLIVYTLLKETTLSVMLVTETS